MKSASHGATAKLLVTIAAVSVSLSLPGVAAAAPGDLAPITGVGRCLDVDLSTDCPDAFVEANDTLNSLAISPDGENAYLGGTDRLVVLDRDAQTGRLTPTACFDGFAADATCASTGVLEGDNGDQFGGDHVVVSPDGKHVYVGGGGNWDNAIFVFGRNLTDGSLTPLSCVSEVGDAICPNADGIVNLADLEISADGKHLYTFADSYGIAVLSRDPASGALSQSAAAPCIAQTAVWRGDADGCTAWTGLGQMSSSNGDADLAVSPDGATVVLGGMAGMLVFTRNATTGALTQSACISKNTVAGCQQVPFVENVRRLAFTKDTNHLYARADASSSSQRLLAFLRPTATSLTPLSGEAACYAAPAAADGCTDVAAFGEFLGGPSALAATDDGSSVVVGSYYGVRSLPRDPSTGALDPAPAAARCVRVTSNSAQPAQCTPGGTPFPSTASLALPADGEHVYAVDASTLLVLEREAPPLPDTAAPTVVSFSVPPLTKATYARGSVVRAAYECADERPGVTCTGPVAAGQPIDTSRLGTSIPFRVVATDAAGHQTSVTHFYDVVEPPPAPPAPAQPQTGAGPTPAPGGGGGTTSVPGTTIETRRQGSMPEVRGMPVDAAIAAIEKVAWARVEVVEAIRSKNFKVAGRAIGIGEVYEQSVGKGKRLVTDALTPAKIKLTVSAGAKGPAGGAARGACAARAVGDLKGIDLGHFQDLMVMKGCRRLGIDVRLGAVDEPTIKRVGQDGKALDVTVVVPRDPADRDLTVWVRQGALKTGQPSFGAGDWALTAGAANIFGVEVLDRGGPRGSRAVVGAKVFVDAAKVDADDAIRATGGGGLAVIGGFKPRRNGMVTVLVQAQDRIGQKIFGVGQFRVVSRKGRFTTISGETYEMTPRGAKLVSTGAARARAAGFPDLFGMLGSFVGGLGASVQKFFGGVKTANEQMIAAARQKTGPVQGLLSGPAGAAGPLRTVGGQVVSAGGANVVSAGGANVVSAGGGNVVSAGGANVVSAGGGNVISLSQGHVISAGGANAVTIARDTVKSGTGLMADIPRVVSAGGANARPGDVNRLLSDNGLGLLSDNGLGLIAASGGNLVTVR